MEQLSRRNSDCTWKHKVAVVGQGSFTVVKNSTWGVIAEIMDRGETHAFAVVGKWGACMLLLKHADTVLNQPMSLLLLLSVLIMPKLFEQIVEFKLNALLGTNGNGTSLTGVLKKVAAKVVAPAVDEREEPK